MNARLTKAPPPAIWKKLGEQIHQDWLHEVENGSLPFEEALKDTFVGWPQEDLQEIRALIEELLSCTDSNSDFKRAWKLAGAQIIVTGHPRDWFELIRTAILDVEKEAA